MIKEMYIETNRLIIRPYKQDDLVECFQLMQEKDLFYYLPMEVMSFDDYKDLFEWLINCYNFGFNDDFKYSFNIILKETGKHIGWCGIGGIDFDHQQKELFYLIGKEYWGNGFATEAAQSILKYGFDVIGLNKIIAVVKPNNIASIKVIENIGLKFQYIIEGLPLDFEFYNGELLYSITKDKHMK